MLTHRPPHGHPPRGPGFGSVLATLLLAACDGGGGSHPTPDPPAAGIDPAAMVALSALAEAETVDRAWHVIQQEIRRVHAERSDDAEAAWVVQRSLHAATAGMGAEQRLRMLRPGSPVLGAARGEGPALPLCSIPTDTDVIYVNGVLAHRSTVISSIETLRSAVQQHRPTDAHGMAFDHVYNPSGTDPGSMTGSFCSMIAWPVQVQLEYCRESPNLCSMSRRLELEAAALALAGCPLFGGAADFIQAFDQWLRVVNAPSLDILGTQGAIELAGRIRAGVATGRAVVVVAHSQGNFFTERALELLPPEVQGKVGVVAVASPTRYERLRATGTLGHFSYALLPNDAIRCIPGDQLEPNVDNATSRNAGVFGPCSRSGFRAHAFVESYLAHAESAVPIAEAVCQARRDLLGPALMDHYWTPTGGSQQILMPTGNGYDPTSFALGHARVHADGGGFAFARREEGFVARVGATGQLQLAMVPPFGLVRRDDAGVAVVLKASPLAETRMWSSLETYLASSNQPEVQSTGWQVLAAEVVDPPGPQSEEAVLAEQVFTPPDLVEVRVARGSGGRVLTNGPYGSAPFFRNPISHLYRDIASDGRSMVVVGERFGSAANCGSAFDQLEAWCFDLEHGTVFGVLDCARLPEVLPFRWARVVGSLVCFAKADGPVDHLWGWESRDGSLRDMGELASHAPPQVDRDGVLAWVVVKQSEASGLSLVSQVFSPTQGLLPVERVDCEQDLFLSVFDVAARSLPGGDLEIVVAYAGQPTPDHPTLWSRSRTVRSRSGTTEPWSARVAIQEESSPMHTIVGCNVVPRAEGVGWGFAWQRASEASYAVQVKF